MKQREDQNLKLESGMSRSETDRGLVQVQTTLVDQFIFRVKLTFE